MKIQLRTAPRAAWKEVDMRTQSANLIYQHSLSLIYLKAVSDCLGNGVRVEIQNSLNKGLYTEIKTVKPLTTRQVQQIEERMRQLVDADLPFVKEIVSREDAMAILEEDGRREKQRMLSESLKLKKVKFYSLEGCRDFFYGFMAPSTGYIEHFQLMKYRRGVLLRFPHPSAPDTMPPYVDEKKMYQAFGEQTKWDRLLGVSYVADLNEKIENGQYKELIQLSEALHEKKIAQIEDMIKKQHKRIVLIAGLMVWIRCTLERTTTLWSGKKRRWMSTERRIMRICRRLISSCSMTI